MRLSPDHAKLTVACVGRVDVLQNHRPKGPARAAKGKRRSQEGEEKQNAKRSPHYFIILQNKNVIIILIIIAFGATTYIIYRILIIQLLLIMIFLLPRQNRVKRSANRIPVGIEIQWWRMALHSVYRGLRNNPPHAFPPRCGENFPCWVLFWE